VSADENKALASRYFEEAWVKRNLAAVDEFMAPNYVEHQGLDGRLTSRNSLKQLLAMYYKAFLDMKSVLHDILAQGDRLAFRWSVSGTHLGDWVGIPPTGNHITATGIIIYRIAEGKAVEGWSSVDNSRSEEEQRWLSEGGRTFKVYPESDDVSLAGLGLKHSPSYDALIPNLTWHFRAAEAQERDDPWHVAGRRSVFGVTG
jgi:predicted ester cyclase